PVPVPVPVTLPVPEADVVPMPVELASPLPVPDELASWEVNAAALAGDVPAGVTTVTETVPAAPDGVTADSELSLQTVNEGAAMPPNNPPVAPANPLPLSDTVVPPAVGPHAGPT